MEFTLEKLDVYNIAESFLMIYGILLIIGIILKKIRLENN